MTRIKTDYICQSTMNFIIIPERISRASSLGSNDSKNLSFVLSYAKLWFSICNNSTSLFVLLSIIACFETFLRLYDILELASIVGGRSEGLGVFAAPLHSNLSLFK